MSNRMKFIIGTAVTLASAPLASPASAAVIFGNSSGGLTVFSTSTAQAKAPSSANVVTDSKNDTQNASTLPASLSASSLAQVNDGGFAAIANNTTTASFSSAGSGTVTFAGAASATAPTPGLAQAASGEYFIYNFTLTTQEDLIFGLQYTSSTLGCCGNQASLQNLRTGQYLFFKNNYGSDNTFNYAGTLQADAYRLFVTKGGYYGYDEPSFNGRSGTSGIVFHNDSISFSIGTQATGAVPEPATWAMMIAGFGLVGGAMRRRGRLALA